MALVSQNLNEIIKHILGICYILSKLYNVGAKAPFFTKMHISTMQWYRTTLCHRSLLKQVCSIYDLGYQIADLTYQKSTFKIKRSFFGCPPGLLLSHF